MKQRSTRFWAFFTLLFAVFVVGCYADPLVVDDDGELRTQVSSAEVEEAELLECDGASVELSDLEEVALSDRRGESVYVDGGIAVCVGPSGLGLELNSDPLEEPTNEAAVVSQDVKNGPTPEPSVKGPTPEPSVEDPTPEPSLWGPTPEPSLEDPTPEPSAENKQDNQAGFIPHFEFM